MEDPGIASEPLGPQAAAAVALEVEAVPDDGTGQAAPGAAQAPDENVVAWDELISFALTIGTRAASQRWPSMQTSAEDIAKVSAVWSPICARRWPIAMTPEIAACVVTIGVFAPKVVGALADEKRAKAEERARRAAAVQDRASAPATAA